MAPRRRRRTTKPKVEEVEEVEEVEVEEEEEEAPKPKTTRSRRRRTRKKVEPKEEPEPEDEEEDEEPEEEEAPKPKTTRSRRTRKKVEPKEEPVATEDEEEEDEPKMPVALSRKLEEGFFLDILAAMESGQTLLVTRKSNSEWILSVSGQAVIDTTVKLKGIAYDNEVQSEEYQEHYAEWKELSDEEKYDAIEEAGVEWEEHDNPKIDMMRATTAYRAKLGIEKYKPQYQDAAARRAIRA